jgi:probable rRNA maturation factor
MLVSVSWQGEGTPSISKARVRAQAERMLAALRLPRAELSVLLCDDGTIHALNHTYRHKDAPTDVLAFAMREGEGAEHAHVAHGVLGDVVISLETASRQARTHARSLEAEVTMLLAHGLLHLLGLDHRTRTEERRMSARTDLLQAAAIGARSTRR